MMRLYSTKNSNKYKCKWKSRSKSKYGGLYLKLENELYKKCLLDKYRRFFAKPRVEKSLWRYKDG